MGLVGSLLPQLGRASSLSNKTMLWPCDPSLDRIQTPRSKPSSDLALGIVNSSSILTDFLDLTRRYRQLPRLRASLTPLRLLGLRWERDRGGLVWQDLSPASAGLALPLGALAVLVPVVVEAGRIASTPRSDRQRQAHATIPARSRRASVPRPGSARSGRSCPARRRASDRRYNESTRKASHATSRREASPGRGYLRYPFHCLRSMGRSFAATLTTSRARRNLRTRPSLRERPSRSSAGSSAGRGSESPPHQRRSGRPRSRCRAVSAPSVSRTALRMPPAGIEPAHAV